MPEDGGRLSQLARGLGTARGRRCAGAARRRDRPPVARMRDETVRPFIARLHAAIARRAAAPACRPELADRACVSFETIRPGGYS